MRRLVWLSSPRSATTRLAVNLRGTIRTEWDEYICIERNSLDRIVLRKQGSAHRHNTNCDIFSWVSSQLAVWSTLR